MEGTIRPWYRSRLFWLGVPGLVFLMWGWIASLFAEQGFRLTFNPYLHRSAPSATILLSTHCVTFWAGEVHGAFTGPRTGVGFWSEPVSPDPRPIGEKLRNPVEWIVYDGRWGGLRIDLWFMITVYMAIWVPSLVYWQRRKARVSALGLQTP
jgi:hypothetical protein